MKLASLVVSSHLFAWILAVDYVDVDYRESTGASRWEYLKQTPGQWNVALPFRVLIHISTRLNMMLAFARRETFRSSVASDPTWCLIIRNTCLERTVLVIALPTWINLKIQEDIWIVEKGDPKFAKVWSKGPQTRNIPNVDILIRLVKCFTWYHGVWNFAMNLCWSNLYRERLSNGGLVGAKTVWHWKNKST